MQLTLQQGSPLGLQHLGFLQPKEGGRPHLGGLQLQDFFFFFEQLELGEQLFKYKMFFIAKPCLSTSTKSGPSSRLVQIAHFFELDTRENYYSYCPGKFKSSSLNNIFSQSPLVSLCRMSGVRYF